MPNGYEHRKYGQHNYLDNDGTSDCIYRCGCWAGPSRSEGPVGLDPIFGFCPNNPLDGKPLREGNIDYEDVVSQRIQALELRAYKAEEALKKVAPGTIALSEELAKSRSRVVCLETIIDSFAVQIKNLKKSKT